MKSREYLGPNEEAARQMEEEKRIREKMRSVADGLDRFDPRARSADELRDMAKQDIAREDAETDGMEDMY